VERPLEPQPGPPAKGGGRRRRIAPLLFGSLRGRAPHLPGSYLQFVKLKRLARGGRYGRRSSDPAAVPVNISTTSSQRPRSAAASTSADPTATAAAASTGGRPFGGVPASSAGAGAERDRSSRTRAKRTRNSTPRHSHTSGAA